jgi:adenine-specific DNA-methyltransferase
MKIAKKWSTKNDCTLFLGDCFDLIRDIPDGSVDLVLTSPPYCMGKAYEDKTKAEDFYTDHKKIIPEIVRVLKPGGSVCWQVGYHCLNGVITPLDFVVYDIMSKHAEMLLRNRIIWTFGHGLHSADRFSGRHETLLWFTKGKNATFNLDSVRVPQKYPGKKAYKGDRKGAFSGNPLGKNPSDVWDIPNVKANHIEKTNHPCQFPIALAWRVIEACSNAGDVVLDPYSGSGTTGAASLLLKRKFAGAEQEKKYYDAAFQRLQDAIDGKLKYRPEDKPVYSPPPNTVLTTIPPQWQQ